MRYYVARVLVEHIISPPKKDYSCFSEVIVLGKYELDKHLDFSQLLFREEVDILKALESRISKLINDCYINAEGSAVETIVREIAKIEDFEFEISKLMDVSEIDERLYTFEENLTFDDFKQRYYIGMFAD